MRPERPHFARKYRIAILLLLFVVYDIEGRDIDRTRSHIREEVQPISPLRGSNIAGDLRDELWHELKTVQADVGEGGLHRRECRNCALPGYFARCLAKLPCPQSDTFVRLF